MDYFEMCVACVFMLFAHVESSEICSTLCISKNQKKFSSEKKNTWNMLSLLGNPQIFATDSFLQV